MDITLIKDKINCILSKSIILSSIIRYFKNIKRGEKIYQRIMKKYGEDATILINHYPGTGDIYITSMFVNAWMKKKGIKNGVITIIGKNAEKIVSLFDITQVEVLSKDDTWALIKFYEFYGSAIDLHIEVLHWDAHAMHTGILSELNSYKDLNYMDFYLEIVFKGLNLCDAEKAQFSEGSPYVDRLFEKQDLIPGKTVLLVPNSKTIIPIYPHFWALLTENLKKRGYSVCTNVADAKEKPVFGTKAVFIPYKHLNYFLEKAGITIQIRCGLSDIIASAKCRKIILYPLNSFFQFGVGTLFDFFSLNNMGISEDAEEYQFQRYIGEKDLLQIINDFF